MGLKTLLFASESCLPPADEAAQIREIVDMGRGRNAALGLSGTLVSARGTFAQVLEGPEAPLRTLMDSIARDPRHRALTVVMEREVESRQLPDWPMSLVYSGASFYVARHITAAIELDPLSPLRAAAGSQLFYLVKELARCGPA